MKSVFRGMVFWLLIALCALGGLSVGHGTQQNEGRYSLGLGSGDLVATPGVNWQLRVPPIRELAYYPEDLEPRVFAIMVLERIPTAEDRLELEALGVRLLAHIPRGPWSVGHYDYWTYASVPWQEEVLDALERLEFHYSTEPMRPAYRLSQELAEGHIGAWARNPDGTVRVTVSLFEDVPLVYGEEFVERLGGQVHGQSDRLHSLSVSICEEDILSLAEKPVIRLIEQIPPPPSFDNDSIRDSLGTEAQAGLRFDRIPALQGAGVVIGVWDAGWVDWSHPDLEGRVTVGDPECASFSTHPEDCAVHEHATHVGGTSIGDGGLSEQFGGQPHQWRGMAPGAEVVSFVCWRWKYTYWAEVLQEYGAAIHDYGIDISTNSWGYDWGGQYERGSAVYDGVVRGDLGRPISIVGSAGNESVWVRLAYQTVRVPNSAKNTIVVGSTDSRTGELSSYSLWGPTEDGRVKPDVVAPGCRDSAGGDGIISTAPLYDCEGCFPYFEGCGTSMSTPAVAGALALMIEQYRLTIGEDPLPSTLKAVLINTAEYLGEAPDFKSGYGLINARAAVNAIRRSPGNIIEGQLRFNEEVHTYSVSVPERSAALKVTLVWDDFPGDPAVIRTLVNDLDLTLVGPEGTVHFPWVLDPDNPGLPATTGVDSTNNVELVHVRSPSTGTWTVRVAATWLPRDPQSYSLAIGSLFLLGGGETHPPNGR